MPILGAAAVGSPHRAGLRSRGTAAEHAVGVGEGRHNGEGAGLVPLPTSRRRRATPEQRAGLIKAGKRVLELRKLGELEILSGQELVDSLGPNEGFLTWSSSPHVMWLARRLNMGSGR